MTETIGQRLKQAREARRQTIEQVVQATRIRAQYVEALERDDFSVMSSTVQGRGFLRLYAQYLELDIEQLLADMRRAQVEAESGVLVKVGESSGELTPFVETVSLNGEKPAEEGEEKPPREPLWRHWLRHVRGEQSTEFAPQTGELPEIKPSETQKLAEPPAIEHIKVIKVQEPPAFEATEVPVTDSGELSDSRIEVFESTASWMRWIRHMKELLSSHAKNILFALKVVFKPGSKREPEFTPEQGSESDSIPEDVEIVEPAIPVQSSQKIFNEIGQQLRQRREMLSLTIEEIERHTHVRKHYLQALESGDFAQLPSSVQTRGMLCNYAMFLDIDTDVLLLRFAEGLQVQLLERHPSSAKREGIASPRPKGKVPLRSYIAADLIFGVGMVLLLLAFTIWGASRIVALQSESVLEATAASISDVLFASPVSTIKPEGSNQTIITKTPIPGEGTLTLIEPTQGGGARVQVNVIAVERTWMRIIVDGKVKFEGRVVRGNAYPFEGEEQIEVLTGNAAALRITYNQRELGLMGTFGEVVARIYLPDGIITPTAMLTATGTATPRITPTPSLTPTPLYTPTAIVPLQE